MDEWDEQKPFESRTFFLALSLFIAITCPFGPIQRACCTATCTHWGVPPYKRIMQLSSNGEAAGRYVATKLSQTQGECFM